MSIDNVGHLPLRLHILLTGLIVALVTLIAVFLGAFPTECSPGYKVVSTWLTQFCAEGDGGPQHAVDPHPPLAGKRSTSP